MLEADVAEAQRAGHAIGQAELRLGGARRHPVAHVVADRGRHLATHPCDARGIELVRRHELAHGRDRPLPAGAHGIALEGRARGLEDIAPAELGQRARLEGSGAEHRREAVAVLEGVVGPDKPGGGVRGGVDPGLGGTAAGIGLDRRSHQRVGTGRLARGDADRLREDRARQTHRAARADGGADGAEQPGGPPAAKEERRRIGPAQRVLRLDTGHERRQQLGAAEVARLGHRQNRREHRRAGMDHRLDRDIVVVPGMGGDAVGEGGAGDRRGQAGAEQRGGPCPVVVRHELAHQRRGGMRRAGAGHAEDVENAALGLVQRRRRDVRQSEARRPGGEALGDAALGSLRRGRAHRPAPSHGPRGGPATAAPRPPSGSGSG